MRSTEERTPEDPVVAGHGRLWRHNRYVYPVFSRRAKGLSIGINVNPDQGCTFGCIYCQVDRSGGPGPAAVDLGVLAEELRRILAEAVTGRIWEDERFAGVHRADRRVNDIAFSGDGEPTCFARFDEAVQVAADARRDAGADLKLVVITNASGFDRPQFRRALPILDANNGEIWAKLDAGTEATFRAIDRAGEGITLDTIVAGIAAVAREREIVVQSLFCTVEGVPPSPAETQAYCERLNAITRSGGRIRLVQVHTVARPPACASVTRLPDEQLEAIAAAVRARTGLNVETYPGR